MEKYDLLYKEDYEMEKDDLLYKQDYEFTGYHEGNTYSLSDGIEALGFGWFQAKLTFIIGSTWAADAIVITLLGILAPSLQCLWQLSPEETAFISTCVFIGMFFGCPFWGFVCDNFGRKMTIASSIGWVAILCITSSFISKYLVFLVAMTLLGFGVAGVGQSITMYSEFIPVTFRAPAVILVNMFYVAGNVSMAFVALLVMTAHGWRVLTLIASAPIFLVAVFSWWLPESPYFLLAAGKYSKVVAVLKMIAHDNKRKLPNGQLEPIKYEKPRGKLLELMEPEHRRTTLILWILWFTSIFSYYGIILCTTILLNKPDCHAKPMATALNSSYATNNNSHHVMNLTLPISVKDSCHVLTHSDYLGFLLTGIGEIPGLVITLLLVEKLGRRPGIALLFLVSSMFMSLLHLCLSKMALVSLIFCLRAFVTGIVQTVYLYTPEVYPTHIRAIGLGSAASMSRLGAIVTPFVSQVMMQTSPHLAIGTYSSMMFMCVFASMLLTKETKGQTLKDDT